jgi:TP901 family phage tail tape measure protein
MADDIQVTLDPTNYLVGVNQIDQANQRLQRSFGTAATGSVGMQKALAVVTPGRAAIAGMTVFAAQAAKSQQGLSNLQATAAVTDVRVDKLSGSIRKMARDMPLGYEASKQLVEQVTKMGVASKGSEKLIESLAVTTSKLGGATGENVSALATGMVELSRATGNNNLDPKRFSALSDSLTKVSAESGASATSVLQFSKAIAPMAQASGIGATGILGISSAFAKMGEDGIAAQNAVSKMMSDMSRSVREGSPEIRTYASMVGKSADEFERLFKSNPAEALTQVTEAIAAAGSGGPRLLEQIGIEGVRGQRAVQNLVASGGMRESISTAVTAYGGGSTDKASEAAFGGLNDSLTRASESATQVAEAFGAPLLGPLTKFTDIITGISNTVGAVAGSGPGQGILTTGMYAGMAAVFAKAVLGPLGIAALGRQALTSSPLRTAAAAVTNVTGSTGFLSRFGAPANEARAEGRMGPRNTALFNRLTGLTQDWQARNPPGGPSTFERIRTASAAYGGNLLQTYMKSVGAGYENAAMKDPFNRKDSLRASEGFQKAWTAAQNVNTAGMSQWQVLRTGMAEFHKELKATTGATAGMRQQFKGFASMAGQMGGFGLRLGADATAGVRGAAMSAVRGTAGFLGPGMALSGGLMLGMYGLQHTREQREANAQLGQADISGTFNRYRESIGKATDTTKTFSQQNQQLVEQLAKNSQVLGFDQTKSVTSEDVEAAKKNQDITHRYFGSPEQVVAQIAGIRPQGYTPEELQAVKLDLLKQSPLAGVERVMQLLPASMEAGKANEEAGGFSRQQIQASVQGVSQSPRNWFKNWVADWQSLEGGNPMGAGQAFYMNPMDEKGQAGVQAIAEGIAQNTEQRSKYGSQYALQEQIKDTNAALKGFVEANDVTGFNEASKRLAVMLGGKEVENVTWSGIGFRDRGYDFASDVASQSPVFKAQLDALLGAGGKVNGPGGITPELQEDITFKTVQAASPFLAQAFAASKSTPMGQAMSASLGTPSNVQFQETAIGEVIKGARTAGMSMMELATQARQTASGLNETGDAFARLKMVQQRAEQVMAYEQMSMTPGQAQMEQYEYHQAGAKVVPTTEAQREEVKGHQQAVVEIEGQMRQRMVARLEMERQYERSSLRGYEDLARQKEYMDKDSETTRLRALRDFHTQEINQTNAANLSIARAEEDFNRSRDHAYRDLHKNQLRAEDAFQTQRERQLRDWNKQLKRSIEDAAKTMYDPYKRIQTQATWDAQNLIVNMAEQTAAMTKQKSQLDQLRGMGLSAQAIDVLGLGKAENAQQVSNLVLDSATDPAVIGQLTAAAAAQASAAALLFTDASNKEITRGKEDLNTNFADQRKDLDKQLGYQNEDLKISLADAEFEMRNSAKRMLLDLKTNLGIARTAMNQSLLDMEADNVKSYTRSQTALGTQLTRMKDDIKAADKVIAGTMSDLAEAVDAAIHGKAINWMKILKDDTTLWVKDMKDKVVPQVGSVFATFGVTSTASGAQSSAAAERDIADRADSGSASVRSGIRHAEGGPVQGYSAHEKADNIPAWLTGGEFVQNVFAVRKYGTEAMTALNNRSVSKEALLAAIRGHAAGGYIWPVNKLPSFPWGRYPSGGYHPAYDLAVGIGTPVRAPYSGSIYRDGWDTTGYGTHVGIHHDQGRGYSVLGHLSREIVEIGQRVKQGETVGYSGNTGNSRGPHVHWGTSMTPSMMGAPFDPMSGKFVPSAAGDAVSAAAGMVGLAAGLISGRPSAAEAAKRIDKLFSGMKDKPGVYNQLTNEAKKRAMKALGYDKGGLMPVGGGGFVNGTGKPEKVLTDDQWGAVSQLAGRGAVSMEDLRGVRTAGGVHITVNNTGAVTYDHRNDFSGAQIQVLSQDPDEMARKLESKAVQQRLTATRGVQR